jgi:uncharacterized protein YoxC
MTVIELWWLSLAIFAVVVVVVAVLLGLIIATAKSIDRHAENIWVAGKQIAGNTVAIWMLQQTNERLEEVTEAVELLEKTAADVHGTLGGRSR